MVLKQVFFKGAVNGIQTSAALLKIILPVFAAVIVLKYTPVIGWISDWFAPAMHLMGLPGEAALVLASGILVSSYAALGAMAAMNLTVWQITTLALMINICHELILESAVLKKAGIPVVPVAVLRLFAAFGAGVLMNLATNLVG